MKKLAFLTAVIFGVVTSASPVLAADLTVQDGSVNDWETFNVAGGETTSISVVDAQGAPMADGRAIINVLQDYASEIGGNLDIYGIIAILNAHGFNIGPEANINVIGGLILSSLGISQEEFFSGMAALHQDPSLAPGFIFNQGNIHAEPGSFLALIAGAIQNTGTIAAEGGTAILAAGREGTLSVGGDGLIHVQITEPVQAEVFDFEGNKIADQIANSGTIQADGGLVKLTAKGSEQIFDNIINHSGMISAKSVSFANGEVILEGGTEGIVNLSGTVDASGEEDGEIGGKVRITGDRIGFFDGAGVNVSGKNGGGEIFAGGGLQGKDPAIQNAARVYLSETAQLQADAVENGNGGRVIVWSNDGTQIFGYISARGGSQSGNGGFIETSSLSGLQIFRAPNVSAFQGSGGTWLIDPYNIEIVAGAGNTNINGDTPFASSGDSAELGVDLIITALGNGDVSIATGAAGSQAGNIVWTADMDFNTIGTNKTLTLTAHNDITLNGEISQSGTPDDSLNIIFNADSDSNGGGAILINDVIETGGGSLTFQDGTYLTANLDTSTNQAGRSGGDITFQDDVIIAKAAGVSLTTTGVAGDGDIDFQSTLNSGNTYSYDGTARTWNAALAAADSGDGDAAGDTYLATATSSLENSIVTSTAAGNQAWLGGSDGTTEGDWRWVTGPEGLENSGAGRQFWSGASGGSAVGGAYTNWNSGEPNDSGGNEDALQLGFGTQGQWNDLPTNSSTLGSVVETNLDPTALTITAGTGSVTFSGVIGANKALGALTVSSAGDIDLNQAATITGNVGITNSGTLTTAAAGDLTATGTFTHSGTGSASLAGDITASSITFNRAIAMNTNVTFYANGASGDLNLSNNITKSAGADATLTLRANDAVLINGVSISSSSNALDIIVNSDRDGNQAGNINIDTGSTLTSNGGDIVLSGGTGTTDDLKTTGFAYGTSAGGVNNRGVYILTSTLSAGAGDIVIRGTGATLNSTVNQGVDIVVNSTVQTTSGDITLVGNAGNGSGQTNQQGVVVYSGSYVTTATGDITVTGTANNSGTGAEQVGVGIIENSGLRATGNGTITVTGTGGTSGSATGNYGVVLDTNSEIEGAGSGAISITATGGAGSQAFGSLRTTNRIGEGATAGTYSGNITLTADSAHLGRVDIETTGDVTLRPMTAGTLIDLGAITDLTANTLEYSDDELDNITASNLTVGRSNAGNVTISSAISPSNVDRLTITTAGSINGPADDNTADITVNKLSLNASSGGIGTTTPLDITIASAFSADTSADNGNIFVDSIGDLPVELIDAGTGTVTIDSTGRIDDHTVDSVLDIIAGTLNITAAGGISTVRELELGLATALFPKDYVVNPVFTGSDLETGEDILDDEDSQDEDFNPTGDVTLKAGGVIGLPDNPIEVNVPGTLTLFAGKERNGVSIVIDGNFHGDPVFLNLPPGLVIINGQIVGGAPMNDLRTSVSGLYSIILPLGANTDTLSGSGYIDFPGLSSYADWIYISSQGFIDDSALQSSASLT